MPLIRTFCVAAVGLFLTAVSQAADFRLEDYFRGTTFANGRFSAINGAKREFKVVLTGKWNGRTLTLVENFTYSDGERDRKTWRFTKTAEGRYTGTREDVIGDTTVRVSGDTARFSYSVYLDGPNRKNRVRFFDRMTLRPDGTVLNNALITKFGLPVGRTRVEFRRER
jgi:hypothetical protein